MAKKVSKSKDDITVVQSEVQSELIPLTQEKIEEVAILTNEAEVNTLVKMFGNKIVFTPFKDDPDRHSIQMINTNQFVDMDSPFGIKESQIVCVLKKNADMIELTLMKNPNSEVPQDLQKHGTYEINEKAKDGSYKDYDSKMRNFYLDVCERFLQEGMAHYNKQIKLSIDEVCELLKESNNCLYLPRLIEGAYHKIPNTCSQSELKVLNSSAAHLDEYLKRDFVTPTGPKKMGTVLHALVLQRDEFKNLVIVSPTISKVSNEGKMAWAYHEIASIGKVTVSEDELYEVKKAAEHLLKHPVAKALISEAAFELSFFDEKVVYDMKTQEKLGTIRRRCRLDMMIAEPSKELIDLLNDNRDIDVPAYAYNSVLIVDLKWLQDNSSPEDDLGRDFNNWGYHNQDNWYTDIVQSRTDKSVRFIFTTIDKSNANDVVVGEIDLPFKEAGEFENQVLMEKYVKVFLNPQAYRGRAKGVVSIRMPNYLKNKIADKVGGVA